MTHDELEQYVNQLIDYQFFSYERKVNTMAKKNRNTENMSNIENMGNLESEVNEMTNNETINAVTIEEQTNTLANHVNDEMKKIMDSMPLTSTGIQESVTKDGKTVTKREYTLVNPIGKRTTLTTFDSAIIESTEKIGLALHGRKVLDFAICKELSKINTPKKLESMGFKNIGEYASALFDLSRVTATQYARIGFIFIDDNYKIKSSILPSSLTKGHLIELLSMVEDENDISNIENAFINGELSDSMSTAKMRKAVKQIKTAVTIDENGLIEDKSKDNGTAEPAEPAEHAEENESKSTPTAKAESIDTSAPESIESLIATILSNVESIKAVFDKINAGGDVIIGYNEHLEAIAALAKSAIGM